MALVGISAIGGGLAVRVQAGAVLFSIAFSLSPMGWACRLSLLLVLRD